MAGVGQCPSSFLHCAGQLSPAVLQLVKTYTFGPSRPAVRAIPVQGEGQTGYFREFTCFWPPAPTLRKLVFPRNGVNFATIRYNLRGKIHTILDVLDICIYI